MKHNEEMNEWCRQLEHLHLPRWNELPELDLYMDQVVTLIERYLGLIFVDKQEKMLTKSMVNNYVKLQLIPAPVKKQYSRRHVALLIAITVLKQIVTIKEVKDGINNLAQVHGEKWAYNYFCEEMENALKQVLKQARGEASDEKSECIPFEELPLKMATQAVACKIVVEKTVQIQTLATKNQEMSA